MSAPRGDAASAVDGRSRNLSGRRCGGIAGGRRGPGIGGRFFPISTVVAALLCGRASFDVGGFIGQVQRPFQPTARECDCTAERCGENDHL